jgi:hypothetical protein
VGSNAASVRPHTPQKSHDYMWYGVLILLVAAGLRFTGLAFGQPIPAYAPEDAALNTIHEHTPLHPDEFLFVQRPLRMLLTGELNPKFFHNPSFLIHTNFVTFWLTGERSRLSWEGREPYGARRQAPFRLYLTGRTFSALGGVLAVAGTIGAARALTGRRGALLAGAVVAVSLPTVQHAHYATTSSLAAGFVAVTLWASFWSLRRFDGRLFALAGIAAGLAAGNRYNAAAVSIVVFVVGLVLLYRERTLRRLLWVGAGYVLFPLTFLFTTPHILFDTAFVWSEFQFITNQYIGYEDNPLNVGAWTGLGYEYGYLLRFGVGYVGMLLALVGLWRGRRTWAAGASVILLVAYSYVVLRTIRPLGAEQMLVPLLPVWAVWVGVGFASVTSPPKRRFIPFILVALVLIPLLLPTLSVVRALTVTDTRYIAQAWAYDNIPHGSRVHLDGPYNVPLDRTLYDTSYTYGTGDLLTLDDIRAAGVEYVIVSDAWFRHFERTPYIDAALVADVTAHLNALASELERMYTVPRLYQMGMNDAMHSASYWHQPEIRIYRVR